MEWRDIPTPPFAGISLGNLMKGPMLCNDGELTDEDMSILENLMLEQVDARVAKGIGMLSSIELKDDFTITQSTPAPSPIPRMVGRPPWGVDPVIVTIHVRGENPHTLYTSTAKNARALPKGVQSSVLVNTYNIHFGLYSKDHRKMVTQLIPYAMWEKYMPSILKHTLRTFCKKRH